MTPRRTIRIAVSPQASDRRIKEVTGAVRLRRLLLSASLMAGVAGVAGCRGRAHDDLYRAQMAQQIRVLEDQLYEADYQNRVLHDELNRNQGSSAACETGISTGPMGSSGGTLSSGNPMGASPSSKQMTGPDYQVLDDSGDSGASDLPMPPEVDGESKQDDDGPQPLRDPTSDTDEGASSKMGLPIDVPTPVPDPDVETGTLLPPKKLVPEDDQIIPGDTLPPSEEQQSPPDKILIPSGTKTLQFNSDLEQELPLPDHLELNDGLSGLHRTAEEGETDGLYLVVTVADQTGKRLNLEDYDVDADLSIVILDPEDKSADPRVGRWDFTSQEVRELIQNKPVDGFHIPLQWQDRIPDGEDVIVHVQLSAAQEVMRCQGRVRLERSVAASHWLPRG